MSTINPIGQLDTNKTGPGQQPALNHEDDWITQTLSERNPLPWQTYLSKDAVNLAGDIKGRADNITPDSLTRNIPKSISLGASQTAQNPMASAIQRKYERDLGGKLQGLRTQTEVNAPLTQSNEMARAGDIYGKQRALQIQNFKEQYDFQMARQQQYAQWQAAQDNAKNAFLGNVLGGIFTFGGMVAGGGFGGGKKN